MPRLRFYVQYAFINVIIVLRSLDGTEFKSTERIARKVIHYRIKNQESTR